MCGIAGMISVDPGSTIGAALAAIEHRGRDDEGIFISSPFGSEHHRACLGHRRLSIIDTSSLGHQPMFTEDKRFSIVYNGELYNYLEIRDELEAKGVRFTTQCDTEVLIKSFREWGFGCLEKLNGMFAFAVWDDLEKELTLVRDRAGIKPLYYSQTSKGFVFGSEIKALVASGIVKAELDLEGFDQFLTFLWPVPPHTLFKGVSQLLPGHYLKWRDGSLTTHEWWDLDLTVEDNDTSEQEWSERVFAALEQATQLEMVAGVPLGAFLSGGIDSSSIVALMARHSERRISTYTTGISAGDLSYDIIPDDVEWSRKVAAMLPVDYHETIMTADVAALLPKLVWHQDAPIIDMAIPTYLLSQQARETQTVMLSGMGGDEVFGGYPRQMAMKLAAAADLIPTGVRRPLMRTLDSLLYGGIGGPLNAPMRNAKKFARSAGMDFEERYLGFGTYFTREMKGLLLTAQLREETKVFDAYRYHKEYFRKCSNASPVNRMLYVDFKTFMPALNLDTTDKASMAANLEVRVPFLNKEVLELSERLPASLKIKGLKRKYILKKAVEGLLPHDVIWRKKAGFGAPIRSWLRNDLRPMIDDLLSEHRLADRGFFEPKAVRKMVDDNLSGKEDYNLQIFQLLTFELWMQQFLDTATSPHE